MNATQKVSRRTSLTVTDQQVLEAYKRLGSVHKAGAELDISHATVHKLLKQQGINRKNPHFSDAERDRLRRDYLEYRDRGDLEGLAQQMGRTKYFICRQAGKLGLTNQGGDKAWLRTWKGMSDTEARAWFNKFKKSLKSYKEFCKDEGIDDLGFWRTMSSKWPDEWEYAVEASRSEDSLYRIGRVFEFKTRDHLIELGYYATRSNRSSTPADVIAFCDGQILLVQCKTDRHAFPPDEWNELYDIASSTGAVPLLAYPSSEEAIEYRRINGHKSAVRHEPQNTTSFQPQV